MRARKKKNCDVRLERCSDYIVDKITLPKNNDRPVYLELGCGKGKFAVEVAEKENCLFYAVEIMKDIIVMAIEKGAAKQLDNIKYIIGSADDIAELCPEHSVDTLFLNFSDPWPKKKAAKRRLTYRAYLEKYKKILKKDGIIAFKTDNYPLFQFSVEEFRESGFEIFDYTEDLHESGIYNPAMTEYEERFTAMGQPIYHLKAKLL